jgi:1,4-dihydroxy-2-naphthoate octaprenyltransferase
MTTSSVSFAQKIRAPFLSSIIGPIVIGTLLSVAINGDIIWLHFVLVLIIGIALHAATNVYNDIYDTIQGTDTINVNRNEFSGGSGILVQNPELQGNMFTIARLSLLVAFLASTALFFLIEASLRPWLVGLYFLSAFFSKYYTAAPVKLAYRGLGEISVWLAFGPMAVLIAAVSQNLTMHPIIIAAMPISGLSTLSILLNGQLIDADADKAAGKWGVGIRWGVKPTVGLYIFAQVAIIALLINLAVFSLSNGYILLLSLLPYLAFLPKIITLLKQAPSLEELKQAAKLTVMLHVLFYLVLILTLVGYLML